MTELNEELARNKMQELADNQRSLELPVASSHTEGSEPLPMKKHKEAMRRAKWLFYCLTSELCSKEDLPELEKIWDSYWDENGNRKPLEVKKEEKMERLKERIQSSIDFIKKSGDNMDSASWNYQEGILLSGNEAELILKNLNYGEQRK